jgi:hypothetical protein
MYREKPHYGYDSAGESETEESDSGDGIGHRRGGSAQDYSPIVHNMMNYKGTFNETFSCCCCCCSSCFVCFCYCG